VEVISYGTLNYNVQGDIHSTRGPGVSGATGCGCRDIPIPKRTGEGGEALEKELRRARDQQLRAEFQEAARDPLFMQDLEETQKAFEAADAETARMIPDG
jgi:hypothetical protein